MGRPRRNGPTITGPLLESSEDGPKVIIRSDELSPGQRLDGQDVVIRKGRKTKLAAFGLSPSIIAAGDPQYAQCLHAANKYRKTRMKELAEAHGSVSAGVGMLVASASLCAAGSRYLFQRAATEAGNPDLLKLASKLTADARQNDIAAWEICAREAAIKNRRDVSLSATPWAVDATGTERDKPGRKTAIERALSEGVSSTVYSSSRGPE